MLELSPYKKNELARLVALGWKWQNLTLEDAEEEGLKRLAPLRQLLNNIFVTLPQICHW
jgi:hypothetical protein